MDFTVKRCSVVTFIFFTLMILAMCEAEFRRQKKVRCHPSCCQKEKKPKSLIGRYMLDVADGSEESSDDIVDLAYVIIKLAKGSFGEFTGSSSGSTNETMYQAYRYDYNMIPNNPIKYNGMDASQRSAVRTRYAPGNGIAAASGVFSGFRAPGSTRTSLFRGLMPIVNFSTETFMGLNVSTQAAVAVSLYSNYKGIYIYIYI